MRHTVLLDKTACTGCGACVSVCPKAAITMCADEEGFLYPSVDQKLCIGCDLCEKRCPAGKTHPENRPLILGAKNRDDAVREASSSGGVFTALAKETLAQGGVVFGAAFDPALHLEHVGAFDEADLAAMRGSKYLQSEAADAIGHAAALLAKDIPVLFSGTPCQVAGLLAKVGTKHRGKLLTVDFVCHGVPSPGVFASYIKALEEKHGKRVVSYTFRDKRHGWKDFYAVATFEDGSEHMGSQREEPYLYGFLQNLYLRPSCTRCDNLRGNYHVSDITIADLWGVQQICPDMDDDRGLSLVMVNSQKGREALHACRESVSTFAVDTEPMQRQNPSIYVPATAHEKRAVFFTAYRKNGFDEKVVMQLLAGPGRVERIVKRIAHLPKGAMRRLRVLFGK